MLNGDTIKMDEKEYSRLHDGTRAQTQAISHLWKNKQEPGVVYRPLSTSLGADAQKDKQRMLLGAQGEKQCAGGRCHGEVGELW